LGKGNVDYRNGIGVDNVNFAKTTFFFFSVELSFSLLCCLHSQLYWCSLFTSHYGCSWCGRSLLQSCQRRFVTRIKSTNQNHGREAIVQILWTLATTQTSRTCLKVAVESKFLRRAQVLSAPAGNKHIMCSTWKKLR
jgi:hypothetical protein